MINGVETHYLSLESSKVALCGVPDPIIDLRPCNGEISCRECRELWPDATKRKPRRAGQNGGRSDG
jgi:hypothetical protein